MRLRRRWSFIHERRAWASRWREEAFAMGNIVARPETGKLFFDFRYKGVRCREQTTLADTPANRKKLQRILQKVEAEIVVGTFEYSRYFPGSPRAEKFEQPQKEGPTNRHGTPLFSRFSEDWFEEMQIQWRQSHITTVR